MVTRHSKQVPMPQSGARGSPLTERRETHPASATATATVEPIGADTGLPFTDSASCSGMGVVEGSRGQVRLRWNARRSSHHSIGYESGRS